jgi:hypothetical protein
MPSAWQMITCRRTLPVADGQPSLMVDALPHRASMQITLFATNADLLQIAQWLLDVPGMTLLEAHSRPDQPNRQLRTVEEVAELIGEGAWGFSAWLETTGAPPSARWIAFEPNTQRKLGAKGRTELYSPAMIGVSRNNDQKGCLAWSSISCWNEKGARQRSFQSDEALNAVDWKALRTFMASLQRKLKKAAPAKLHACLIMEDAFSKLRAGDLKLWNFGAPCAYPAPDIVLK